MFTKRIIPCLDVHNGRVVKGVNFVNLKDAGDPVEIAAAYDALGADELVFLDITASSDSRNIVVDMVRRVAQKVFIPFTVGGGIRTVEDFRMLLREGADKISINSSAINTPQLISDAADKFGSQCVVVAIDAKKRADGSGWNVYKNGGRIDTGLDAATASRPSRCWRCWMWRCCGRRPWPPGSPTSPRRESGWCSSWRCSGPRDWRRCAPCPSTAGP